MYSGHAPKEHPEDETFPGLLLLRIEGRVFFANAEHVGQKIRSLVDEAKPKVLVLDLTAVSDLEYTALKMLSEGERRIREQGILLWLVGLNPEVLRMVKKSPLGKVLGAERMQFSVELAVRRCREASAQESPAVGIKYPAYFITRLIGSGADLVEMQVAGENNPHIASSAWDRLRWDVPRLIALFLCVLFTATIASGQIQQSQNVLIISEVGISYSLTNLIVEQIDDQVHQVPGRHVELYTESLNLMSLPDQVSQEEMRDWLTAKYSRYKLDAIVAVGPETVDFLSNLRTGLIREDSHHYLRNECGATGRIQSSAPDLQERG